VSSDAIVFFYVCKNNNKNSYKMPTAVSCVFLVMIQGHSWSLVLYEKKEFRKSEFLKSLDKLYLRFFLRVTCLREIHPLTSNLYPQFLSLAGITPVDYKIKRSANLGSDCYLSCSQNLTEDCRRSSGTQLCVRALVSCGKESHGG
jgi:hypothetical protein